MTETPCLLIFSMGASTEGECPEGFEPLREPLGKAKYFRMEKLGNVLEVSHALIRPLHGSRRGFEKALSRALPYRVAFKRFDARRDLYIYRLSA